MPRGELDESVVLRPRLKTAVSGQLEILIRLKGSRSACRRPRRFSLSSSVGRSRWR